MFRLLTVSLLVAASCLPKQDQIHDNTTLVSVYVLNRVRESRAVN